VGRRGKIDGSRLVGPDGRWVRERACRVRALRRNALKPGASVPFGRRWQCGFEGRRRCNELIDEADESSQLGTMPSSPPRAKGGHVEQGEHLGAAGDREQCQRRQTWPWSA